MMEPFYGVLSAIGIAVTIAGALGILAANIQMKYLIKKWDEYKLEDKGCVRPFGSFKFTFRLGLSPCYLLHFALLLAWLYLLYKMRA